MNGPLSITSPVSDRLPPSTDTAVAKERAAVRRVTTTTAPMPADRPTDEPDSSELVRLRNLLTDPDMRVSTHHDRASGRVVFQIQRGATGELVEQFPSEDLVRLYAMLRESLIDERA